VTAIFLKLNPETHVLDVVNAGHNPGFLLSGDGTVHEIAASGTPIGLVPMMEYTSESHAFQPGSRLLFYTDGLTEVFQGDDEFGPERLLATFQECKSQDCTAIPRRSHRRPQDSPRRSVHQRHRTRESVE
jgi:serine phosphatase RsbU (regulator of sigma subunit)